MTNLPSDYNEMKMMAIFKDMGIKVLKAKLLYDDAGKSKCAGFVDFGSSEDAG